MSAERVYWIWLATRPGLRTATLHRLLEGFGSPEHLYAAARADFVSAGCLRQEVASLCDKDLGPAYAILHSCARQQIDLLTLEDSGYPALLREIEDPPLVLYVRGRLPDFSLSPAVAVVGTRRISPYGARMAERFGAGLAQGGFTVVSGMALGVDTAAHRGCLRAGGRTVAVLAGGVDLCYPPQNKYLMGDILLEGAVISENPPGTGSEGFRFPVRNRIVSGLAMATLVVEAPERSGALITARRAFDQGREVFAVPGPLDALTSAGCNALIRDELARLVTSPVDIGRALAGSLRTPLPEERIATVWARETGGSSLAAPQPAPKPKPASEAAPAPEPAPEAQAESRTVPESAPAVPPVLPPPISPRLSADERAVLQALRAGADTVDAVAQASGLSAAIVGATLVILELDGLVNLTDGRYSADS